MVDNLNPDQQRLLIISTDEQDETGPLAEPERLLPIANVGRIMKQILPPSAKISREAKETMQECVSEFISFITCEASDRCRKERRKTVNGDDICWALSSLGFDDYSGSMKRYLGRYREAEGERANQNRVVAADGEEEGFSVGAGKAGKGTFWFDLKGARERS